MISNLLHITVGYIHVHCTEIFPFRGCAGVIGGGGGYVFPQQDLSNLKDWTYLKLSIFIGGGKFCLCVLHMEVLPSVHLGLLNIAGLSSFK